MTRETKFLAHGRRKGPYGPNILFAAALLATAAAWILAAHLLTSDFVLPVVSTLLFLLAAAAALIAWSLGPQPPEHLSYWDVAGALTFIGIFAATFSDAEQLLRVVEGPHRDR